MMYAFTRPIRDGRTGKAVPASRFIGPNVGRWDYLASMYRATRADLAGIPPDTNLVTMDGARFLAVYEQYVSDMARRRAAVPWGGMSANILLRATLRPGDCPRDVPGGGGPPPRPAGTLRAATKADHRDPGGLRRAGLQQQGRPREGERRQNPGIGVAAGGGRGGAVVLLG